MTNPADQIWAYLHNELAPEEKARFEQALQSDPGLRERLEACRQTHRELESVLPLLNEADDDLDQQKETLISEWEADHPEYAEIPIRKPRRKILYFGLSLAAAAAVLFFLALPQEPIRWQRTAYGAAPQLRGQPEVDPCYSHADLKKVSRKLQNAVGIHLEQLADPPEPWNLKIHLQELAEGALAIEISGYPHGNPEHSIVWNETFQGLEHFNTKGPLFGRQVAEALVEQDQP